MNLNKIFWENTYKKYDEKPPYDLWLEKQMHYFEKFNNPKILDLGCGKGNNSIYLGEKGFDTICADFSENALKLLKKFLPNTKSIEFDMQNAFPFNDNEFDIIIADLSIHYFSKKTTQKIIVEISRILKNNGILFCRTNSTNDLNHSAGQGEVVEKNFYLTRVGHKRFFDETDIKNYFNKWELKSLEEKVFYRYTTKKILWEFVAINNKQELEMSDLDGTLLNSKQEISEKYE